MIFCAVESAELCWLATKLLSLVSLALLWLWVASKASKLQLCSEAASVVVVAVVVTNAALSEVEIELPVTGSGPDIEEETEVVVWRITLSNPDPPRGDPVGGSSWSSLVGEGDLDLSESPPVDMGSGEDRDLRCWEPEMLRKESG